MLASASCKGTIKIWDIGLGSCLQTFERISGVTGLSFSAEGTHLRTGQYILALEPRPGESNVQPDSDPALCIEDAWIIRGSQKLLWLPPEYRPRGCTAVHKSMLVCHYKSTHIVVFEFSF
jgi:hypothetical protein